MSPIVSILMPCYNQGEFLEEAVQSVLQQTYDLWECIIVNDGSTDNTDDVARQLAKKDERIKYFSQDNSGVCLARNLAASKAEGEFLLPLDADDFISDNYIEVLLNSLQGSKATTAYGKVYTYTYSKEIEEYILEPYRYPALILANMIHVCGMYRKVDFDSVGGYDRNMVDGYEDWEFWINILKSEKKAIYIPEASLFYRKKETSRMTEISLQKRYRMIAYIYKKHSELYEEYVNDFSKTINLNLAYSFYLSGVKYNLSNKERLSLFFKHHYEKTLKNYTFLQRKRILFRWYKKGKVGINLFKVLVS